VQRSVSKAVMSYSRPACVGV